MTDVIGGKFWGPAPNYDLWIDIGDILSRVLSTAAVSAANGTIQTIDFAYTAPEKPWVSVLSGNCGAVTMSYPSAGIARLTFDFTGLVGASGTVMYGSS